MERGTGGGSKRIGMMAFNQSDFWWLTEEESKLYRYIFLCYQEPYSDEPNTDKEPTSVKRYCSLDASGILSKEKKHYPIDFIQYWKKKNNNINVFRSHCLFSDEDNSEKIYGPLIIDIDRENGSYNEGYMQNLDLALKDTYRLIDEYFYKLAENDFRIFFTGHKGFNIEVHPKALQIYSSLSDRYQQFTRIRKEINRVFGDSFADKLHNEVRMHDSINRFISSDGVVMNRMKFEINIYELKRMTVDEICFKSEKLALDYVSK